MQIKTSDAVSRFGSVKDLADKLGIRPQAIYQWGEYVPEPRVYQIHVLSNGELPPAQPAVGVCA